MGGRTNRPFIVTSAAIAEATHILGNSLRALEFLEKLVARLRVEDPAPGAVLAEMQRWAGETLAVLTLPESSFETLRCD